MPVKALFVSNSHLTRDNWKKQKQKASNYQQMLLSSVIFSLCGESPLLCSAPILEHLDRHLLRPPGLQITCKEPCILTLLHASNIYKGPEGGFLFVFQEMFPLCPVGLLLPLRPWTWIVNLQGRDIIPSPPNIVIHHNTINPSIFCTCCIHIGGCRGVLEPMPAVRGREAGSTRGIAGPTHKDRQPFTPMTVGSWVWITSMPLESGRNPKWKAWGKPEEKILNEIWTPNLFAVRRQC